METKINGKMVTLPAIIGDLDQSYYHSKECPGVSKSGLDLINRSPMHYLYSLSEKKESTAAMEFGSMVHKMILEQDSFDDFYIVAPDCDKRTKEGKAAWEAFKEEAGDKKVISEEDYDRAISMFRAVYSCKTAVELLAGATIESSAFALDAETNVIKKCRPDAVKLNERIIIDLKTTNDCSLNEWRREIIKWNLDKQAAYYLDTYSEASGQKFDTFIFICVEKQAPHGVAVYMANDSIIETGRALYKRDLIKYRDFFSSDFSKEVRHYGYPDEIQQIDMAAYGFDLQSR